MRKSQAIAVVIACVLLLPACRSSQAADPPPSPTPTYECTAPGTCTPQQAAKEQAAEKAHREAEAALKAGVAELYRLAGEGGAETPSPTLKAHVTGSELTSAMRALESMKDAGRVGHGAARVARVRFLTAYPTDSQRMWVCEDGTHFYTTNRAGKDPTAHGVHLTYTATMTLIDGAWKRSHSTDPVRVPSCDS